MIALVSALLALLALLGGVTPDATLTAQAQTRADDMAEQGTFAHDLGAYEPGYCGIGELLARAGNQHTAVDVMAAWQGSPTHAYVLDTLRANRAGVGVGVASGAAVIWVLVVARAC